MWIRWNAGEKIMSVINYTKNPIVGKIGRDSLLNINELFLDYTYQRIHTSTRDVRDHARDFSWELFGKLIIADYGITSPKGQRYAVVDGGGRVASARLRGGSDVEYLPCLIYDATPLEAAEMYYHLNTDRKNPTSIEKFKAALVFGEPDAIAVDSILKKYDIVAKTGKKSHTIEAVVVCVNQYKQSPEDFVKTIDILSDLCKDAPITQYLLMGTFYIVQNAIDIENSERLQYLKKRMLKVGFNELNATTTMSSNKLGKGARVLAEVMLNRINMRISTDNAFYLKPPKKIQIKSDATL